MNKFYSVLALVVLLAVVVIASATFIVDEKHQAVVFRFGQIVRTVNAPVSGDAAAEGPDVITQEAGLQFKMPWPFNTVVYFSRQIQAGDLPAEEVTLRNQQRLTVETAVRWRIVDPGIFYTSLGQIGTAQERLVTYNRSSVRKVLGEATLESILSIPRIDSAVTEAVGEVDPLATPTSPQPAAPAPERLPSRSELMASIRNDLNERVEKEFGIHIVDVRIRRADLPAAVSSAVFQRMISERQKEAQELRALGEQQAQEIQSTADRERTVLLAEAEAKAQLLRGEGDKEAIAIYAQAFNRDPSFYAFYRSMQAYRTALGSSDTTMVLAPDSYFFRYLSGPEAQLNGAPAVPPGFGQ